MSAILFEYEGGFTTDDGNYGHAYLLEDGTRVYVVSVFTGCGLECDTEVEANRPLTDPEIDAVVTHSGETDAGASRQVEYDPSLPVQRRF